MPTILPLKLNINCKHALLTILIVFLPLFFFGQTLTGLWSGSMSQDSTTSRKDQSFEIALTEYKGKVYGYSCSEFIVNDTLYYIVKRVKGTIEGDVCEVVDDEIIAYNFRGKLDKGVKVTSTFRRNTSDSAWYLDGTWKTNATKKYYSVTGKVGLKEEKDMAMSRLFPHLEELKLAKDVAFYQERKETPVMVRVAKPESIKPTYTESPKTISLENDVAIVPSKPVIQKTETEIPLASINKRGEDLKSSDPKTIQTESVNLVPSALNKDLTKSDQAVVSINKRELDVDRTEKKQIGASAINLTPSEVTKSQAVQSGPVAINKKEDIALNKTETKTISTSATNIQPDPVNKTASLPKQPVSKPVNDVAINNKPNTVKNEPVVNKPANTLAKTTVKQEAPVKKDAVSNPVTTAPVTSKPKVEAKSEPVLAVVNKKTDAEIIQSAKPIEGRKSEFAQVVNFSADSLVLSLYDNGQIDGDTVSVFMDGEVLMSKQGLRSRAINKTIYLPAGKDDFTLVLFADNLGAYPPNTGLLVVRDGEDIYNLHFSSDMQKSTGIVFRRKQ